jgi:hypothetical protein
LRDGLRFTGKALAILLGIGLAFVVFLVATIYIEAWWTGRGRADFFP